MMQLGAEYVLATLNNLYAIYGEEKYRASLYLKQYVAKQQCIRADYSKDLKAFA